MTWLMDHIVLNVADMDAMLAFYMEVLELPPERVAAFRAGDAPFPSVRLNPDTIIDFFPKAMWSGMDPAQREATNLNHFCVTLSRGDWDALRARLAAHEVAIEIGPVPRWGAHGTGTSIYFRDPEGNQIEARTYQDAC